MPSPWVSNFTTVSLPGGAKGAGGGERRVGKKRVIRQVEKRRIKLNNHAQSSIDVPLMPLKSCIENEDNKPWSVKPWEARTDSEGQYNRVFIIEEQAVTEVFAEGL